MTDIFKNSLKLIDETLNNMYLKEDEEERFVSIANQDNSFNPSNPGSNFYTNHNELDADKEEEKRELTDEVMDKIKQSLKVSDELQSILNRIKKINDDIDTNKWKINEEDNTAILRSKNARIFKQNENLCLSHDGKIEIFKSVAELHDWLKKNNYPLPEGIVLHESVITEENINRTPGWKEIKDLIDQNEKLQQELDDKNRFLSSRTRKFKREISDEEKKFLDKNPKKDITDEDITNQIKDEIETLTLEVKNISNQLNDENLELDIKTSLELKKEDIEKQIQELNKLLSDKNSVYTQYEQIKKQIDDNKQKILDIYKKYNAEPGSWDPNYSEIEIPEADYSVPKEEQIWNDDVTEDKIETLDVPEITDDADDNIALRTKARYANTKWGPILQHRWNRLGDRESWTPEDIEKHKEEYISKMNPNARGMSWEQEKAAKLKNDIHRVKNPYVTDTNKDYAPKTMYNDLIKGKDFSAMKKESTEDNQITDNEIWYLEYQIDDIDNKHYLNSNWRDENLISDNLETAAKFTSREDAINELKELYSIKKLPFPLKPITGLNMNECGVTCAGLGSAVQYLGNKKKEENLEESLRSQGYEYSASNKNAKNSGEIVDLEGNHLGKVGKTAAEYQEEGLKNPNGFSYDEDSLACIYQDSTRGIQYKFQEKDVYRRIALDDNDMPIGFLANKDKIYNFENKQIGTLNEKAYYAKMNDEERKRARENMEANDKNLINSRAGNMWKGHKDAPKLFKKGELKPELQLVWNSEPFVSNEALQKDPSLMYAFAGYNENDREAIENRINEINQAFGLNLTPNEPVVKIGAKGQNREEYEKWKNEYFKPLFYNWRKIDANAREMLTNDDIYNSHREKLLANDRAMANFNQDEINNVSKKADSIIDSFNNGKIIGTKNLIDMIKNEVLMKNIPNDIKKNIISKTANAAASYLDDEGIGDYVTMRLTPLLNQQNESVSFNKCFLSLLTEAPTPADFADGAANIASDMTSATTGANNTSTTNLDTQDNIASDGLDDYGPEEPGMDGGLPSFGDININGGSGGMDDETPMPSTKNERIVDVLVNENDMSQMKVKVKDLDTNKIDIRDLNEIDV